MSRFVHTNHGEINVSCIVSAKRVKQAEGGYRTEIRYREGKEIITAYAWCESLETHTAPVVSAQPGFSVALLSDGSVILHPVIAWRIDGSGFPEPITLSDAWSCTNLKGIVCPDGSVECTDIRYGSLDEFLTEIKKV